MTAPSSHVFPTDEDESEGIIVYETLSQSCSTDEDESKGLLLTKLCRISIPRTRTNYVLQRNTNQNALLQNKKTQIMRLHNTCRTILTHLTYYNVEERFWTYLTCYMKERAWPLQQKNNL